MDVIEEIKALLQKYADAKCESNDNSISVSPISSDGFTVSLFVDHDSYTVSFNGWHEEFRYPLEALSCFAFGLSSHCRLKEYLRGNVAWKWTLESKENGEWVEESTTGLLLFPFWMKKKTRYLQNALIDAELDLS